MSNSRFEGNMLEYVMYSIAAIFLSVLTFGIATPWIYVMFKKWEINNTIIDGKRLYFEGTAMGLIGRWLVWLLLIFVTFGIYAFWVRIKLKQWEVSNTHF